MLFHSSQSHKWLLNVVRTNVYVVELMTEWLTANQLEKIRLRSHLSLEVLFDKARWIKAISELGICVLPEMDPSFRPILWAKTGPHSGFAGESARMIWACPGPPFSAYSHTELTATGASVGDIQLKALHPQNKPFFIIPQGKRTLYGV